MMHLFLFIVIALAAIIDQCTMRIPNWLTGSLLLVGSIYCLYQGKAAYFLVSITVLLLFLPVNFGGGDKKILMVMPLYLQKSTMCFLGIFSVCYLAYYYIFRVYLKQKEDKPLGPIILLALALTLLRIHCFSP